MHSKCIQCRAAVQRPEPVLGRTLFTYAAFALLFVQVAAAAERAAAPTLVLAARNAAELTGDIERLLTTAGAPQRASQFRGILEALNGLNGVDQERPLGVLAYLSAVEGQDPDLILFVPIRSMEDLQASVARIPQITLKSGETAGWWELRAGQKTIPLRFDSDYAFLAQRDELLADPLPNVREWANPDGDVDLALMLHTSGVPAALTERALAELYKNLERDLQRKSGESADEHALRSQLLKEAGWLIEHTLQDVGQVSVGLQFPNDSSGIKFDVRIAIRPETELSRALLSAPATSSQFDALLNADAPFVAAANLQLSGSVQQLAQSALGQLRRDIERRMQQDGSANGPAAGPIRDILDAIAATVTSGHMETCLRFNGERPGHMLLIAASRLSEDPQVAAGLDYLLPIIAETPAIADLEMNAIKVDGFSLHRLTFQEVRKQDEWLYGPDVGLYLGAGRGALWIAAGGFEREDQLKQLLAPSPAATDVSTPSLLNVDLRLRPWLAVDDLANARGPAWLKLAHEAFTTGGDGLHFELSAQRGELRLHGHVEEGYIRLLGAAWRARRGQSSLPPAKNLAAPVQP